MLGRKEAVDPEKKTKKTKNSKAEGRRVGCIIERDRMTVAKLAYEGK
jgi:hypothetical protein